ncbi:hypothetical protein Pmani_006854 [Petrolisthes manimaculis]|uniref:Uncharacterized protein n=1 Tax=Petrolisthes manimaculis TaxID=1843537 RepID=A0AAE1Q8Z0_9EUCA|nr:hypothetical protein Pmani_006854 [Petrolisthes manimaculis]
MLLPSQIQVFSSSRLSTRRACPGLARIGYFTEQLLEWLEVRAQAVESIEEEDVKKDNATASGRVMYGMR